MFCAFGHGRPGHSPPDPSNGEEVFLFACFHQRVLHRILSKLECFQSFERYGLASVAAVSSFAELYQYHHIARTAQRSLGIRRCQCANDHKSHPKSFSQIMSALKSNAESLLPTAAALD
ncbi:unnamed protein product [Ceratitis capitata]|uniref:(Mediterranean fruit fly) hypothetical protein n=1 Tax=Ceratitis capitata TaxID=7213 RepID=A0A811UTJ1_CERCA|nr:unnamed protein product [Ceratitis capitata]